MGAGRRGCSTIVDPRTKSRGRRSQGRGTNASSAIRQDGCPRGVNAAAPKRAGGSVAPASCTWGHLVQTGGRQGDPLAPQLFSLGLQEAVEAWENVSGLLPSEEFVVESPWRKVGPMLAPAHDGDVPRRFKGTVRRLRVVSCVLFGF